VSEATLRLLDKADKEILKLPRSVKGAIYDFQHKFRKDPGNPGLRLKQLKGDSRLYSARVTQDYRALLLHVGGQDYLLVAVKPRGEVYENLDRYSYQVNPISGGIEFVDLVSIENTLPAKPVLPKPVPALFDGHSDEQLLGLGVTESLLPLIRKITTEEELLGLAEYAPQLTGEVLLGLYDGKSFDEVLEQITRPIRTEDTVDADDFEAALARPATQVTTDDVALKGVLEEGFERWQVFLHPTQQKLVDRDYSGPARVSGGPGTGKTIVALHRVKHLVERLGPGHGKDVLFTTFNRNLAADLRKRLQQLGDKELTDRVEVINIDRLALKIATEGRGDQRRFLKDDQAIKEWREMLLELGENTWDEDFLSAEWTQVILNQGIASRTEYFRARRSGRSRTIGRAQRAEIWQLIEKFTKRLDDKGLWTGRQIAERAARIEVERARNIEEHEANTAEHGTLLHREDQSGAWLKPRYRHIVVDEAQDLNAAHWRMLRAMVPPGRNDLFLVGDTHQRIYDNYVSLGKLGVKIVGRSYRLSLSYRTTHEILASALGILGDQSWDDLDGGTDHLAGYHSILRGPRPDFRPEPSWSAELDGIVRLVTSWNDVSSSSVAVCVPERWMVGEVESHLGRHGILAAAIGSDGPKVADAVHVGTMHRFKGLEYQRMIIAGVADGLVPPKRIEPYADVDPLRYTRELQRARSLLFVAATRARDTLIVSWHGEPSPFLPPQS
jgi:hypothetical protein